MGTQDGSYEHPKLILKLMSKKKITILCSQNWFIFNAYSQTITLGMLNISIYLMRSSLSDITPCNKINKPLVVYRFAGNVMTSIIRLRKIRENLDVSHQNAFFKYLNVI